MLEKLKNLNLDRLLDLDEAVALSAYARTFKGEYQELSIVTPEWLEKSIDTLRAEIARRTHAADLAAMKSLENELESYRTVSERRNEAQKRYADLQRKLGIGAKAGK